MKTVLEIRETQPRNVVIPIEASDQYDEVRAAMETSSSVMIKEMESRMAVGVPQALSRDSIATKEVLATIEFAGPTTTSTVVSTQVPTPCWATEEGSSDLAYAMKARELVPGATFPDDIEHYNACR